MSTLAYLPAQRLLHPSDAARPVDVSALRLAVRRGAPDALDTLAAHVAQADGPVALRAVLGEYGLLAPSGTRDTFVLTDALPAWSRVAAVAAGWDASLLVALLDRWPEPLAVLLAANPALWSRLDARRALRRWVRHALRPLPADPRHVAYAVLDALVARQALTARELLVRELLTAVLPPATTTAAVLPRLLPILLGIPSLPPSVLRRIADALHLWVAEGLGVTMVLDDLAHHPHATPAVWSRMLVPGTPLGRNAAVRLGASPLLERRVAFRRYYRAVAAGDGLAQIWRPLIVATPPDEFPALYRSAPTDDVRHLIALTASPGQLARLPKAAFIPLFAGAGSADRARALLVISQSPDDDGSPAAFLRRAAAGLPLAIRPS